MHSYSKMTFAVVAAALLLPAFASAESVIGLANRNGRTDKFLGILQQSAVEAAAAMPGTRLEPVDAGDDAAVQLRQVQAMAARPVQALVVFPVSSDTAAITLAARAAHVPVVYVNQRPAEPMGNGAVFVGSNEKMAGRLQGLFLARKLDGSGKVVILKGPAQHEAAINRTKGLRAVLAAYPGMEVVAEEVGSWQRAEAARLVRELLRKGTRFTAVAANNDEMALGAVDALAQAGIPPGQVAVIGVDATPDALAAVRSGQMAATVLQKARGQAKAAVELASRMIAREPVPSTLWIPFELVTPDKAKRLAGSSGS